MTTRELTICRFADVRPQDTAVMVIPITTLYNFQTVFLAVIIIWFFPSIVYINYWRTVAPLVAAFCSEIIESNPKSVTTVPFK